jgi:hypothetical protein
MVTKIKVNIDTDLSTLFDISYDFQEMTNLDILDHMLVEVTECGNFEYLYLFMDVQLSTTFINLLLDYGIAVYEKSNYYDEFKQMIKSNTIDSFKNRLSDLISYDTIIDNFYKDFIVVDDVLDKINLCGSDSLNHLDYMTLSEQ